MKPAPYPRTRLLASAGGFTLLEMSMVMFIMAVLVGVSVFSFGGVSQEEILRRPALELQRMVMEAVRRASLYERPQTIAFDGRGFTIRYRTDVNGQKGDSQQVWQRKVAMPETVRLSLRRFGSDKFAPAAGQRLVVAPSGLCEPVTARFEMAGGSFIEVAFDPLSGVVRDEAMNIVGDGS